MGFLLRTKRVYEPKAPDDGVRVLVDRLWPRGLSKAKAALDLWLKDAAPSTELREWFAHRVDRWDEFCRRYLAELATSSGALELRALTQTGTVTLLYGARDKRHNEAVVLAAFLGGITVEGQVPETPFESRPGVAPINRD